MMNKIQYFIIGRFTEGNKYGIVSKQAVEGYQIDDIAAVRKTEGRQGAYWTIDSFKTGIGIVITGCKTRKAAIENYEKNWREKVSAILTEDRLKKSMEDLNAAPSEDELKQYEEIEYASVYDWRIDKVQQAAQRHRCIIKAEQGETWQRGGHFRIYGTAAMLADVRAIINEWKEKETMKAAEEQKINAAEQIQQAEQNTAEPVQDTTPEKIDVSTLTAENIADYLPGLLMSLAHDKHNSSIILAAGIQAGVIPPVALLDYFHTGRMPAVHTFDIWKKAGYIVKKGEKAAFTARIWKFTEKAVTLTAEDAAAMNAGNMLDGVTYAEGDTIQRGNFIKKVAFFFTAAQIEKAPELKPLPDLPEDVKKETRGGCCWISGNTKPIKESLKAAGFRWSKKNSAWYRREAAA